jgi:hypothetical protein
MCEIAFLGALTLLVLIYLMFCKISDRNVLIILLQLKLNIYVASQQKTLYTVMEVSNKRRVL